MVDNEVASSCWARKELNDLFGIVDLVPVDSAVIERARAPFAVNVRALDAIHVATAEILLAESNGERLEFWTHEAAKRQRRCHVA